MNWFKRKSSCFSSHVHGFGHWGRLVRVGFALYSHSVKTSPLPPHQI